ncbi:MAG: hypothetical protein ACYCYO_20750 [Bacilli bacterium]
MMQKNTAYLIRQAFVERVPLDRLKKTKKEKEAVQRYRLTDDDLVKHMHHAAIRDVRMTEIEAWFAIEVQHEGQPLTVGFSATKNKKGNLVFWIRSITARV